MPKILVADDNSNIQKMVGLALKDHGIDVVAVGNGEAAVRKIADLRPDLVLADVFMPVRNGYEVCQFVKMDSALSHIPVILLVGAFDPLDEQEAQRVGADGVLKKPFIPPDPLISMVKSALQRSGHTGAAAPKASAPEAAYGAKDMAMPGAASGPTPGRTPVPEFRMESGPETANESVVEEVPPKPEPLRIDASSQPVAFGSLLETPAEEAAEDSSFATKGTPEFTMEHDWRNRDEEEVAEAEQDEESPAWRPEGTGDQEDVPAAQTKKSKSKSGAGDWRTGGFEQIAAGKSRNTGWEPEEQEPAPAETAPVASSRVPGTPAVAAPVEQGRPLSNQPPAAELWTPPVPPPAGSSFPAVSSARHSAEAATAVVEGNAKTAGGPRPAGDRKDGKDAWFSSSPWEGEIQKANQLASTWDAPTLANPGSTPQNGNEKANGASQGAKAIIEADVLPPGTVEAIREEAAQVAEDATFIVEADESASEGSGFYAQDGEEVVEPNGSASAPAPPAASNMDDLVAKVLAKMSPEVLQAVTREILKPVVEAMVKEELKAKK